MYEHLVVKARRQKAAEMGVDRAHVEFKARPVVLRGHHLPVKQLGRCGALVRLVGGPAAHVEQRIGLLAASGHDAARTVVLERPAHQHLIVGQQGRGQRVALYALEPFAVEGEMQRCAAGGQLAALLETCAHENVLHDQPGRLAVIASLMSCGGS